jgi:hypothetical protein
MWLAWILLVWQVVAIVRLPLLAVGPNEAARYENYFAKRPQKRSNWEKSRQWPLRLDHKGASQVYGDRRFPSQQLQVRLLF